MTKIFVSPGEIYEISFSLLTTRAQQHLYLPAKPYQVWKTFIARTNSRISAPIAKVIWYVNKQKTVALSLLEPPNRYKFLLDDGVQ